MDIATPSLQSLRIEMHFDEMRLSSGTGFIARGRNAMYLITNRHNVTGRDQHTGACLSAHGGIPNNVVIRYYKADSPGEFVSYREPLLDNDEPLWFEHPYLGPTADFVALKVTNASGAIISPIDPASVGVPIKLVPAEPVSVIGFPFGLTGPGSLPIWATGFLASEPHLDYDGVPQLLIDCRTRPGQSGSPVFAYRGTGSANIEGGFGPSIYFGEVSRFIGIYSGRIRNDSDIGTVWKASAISELLASLPD
ncbi:S1 family peptidase [Herbaspirillum huttiense]|uniref:S1 family peptidase n=1 Tax=Herbaspirillum huttiense TaxID=863372 RepID=UPI0039AEE3C4